MVMVFIKDIELARYGWAKVGLRIYDAMTDRETYILQDLPLGSFVEGKLTDEVVCAIFNKCRKALHRHTTPQENEAITRQIRLMI